MFSSRDGTAVAIIDPAHNFDIGSDTLISVEGIWGTEYDGRLQRRCNSPQPRRLQHHQHQRRKFSDFGDQTWARRHLTNSKGGGGNDTVTGNGNTRVAFYHATAGVVVTLGANGFGNPPMATPRWATTLSSETRLAGVSRVRGSEFNDIITGNGGNNTLEGQGGNDRLEGVGRQRRC